MTIYNQVSSFFMNKFSHLVLRSTKYRKRGTVEKFVEKFIFLKFF